MQDLEEHEAGMSSSPRRVGVLLAAVVALAVTLFSLGVMVGKKARVPAPEAMDPPAALPTETLVPLSPEDLPEKAERATERYPAGESGVGAEKLTFFDRLAGEEAGEPALPQASDRESAPPAPATVKKAVPEPPAAAPEVRIPEKPRKKKPDPPPPSARLAALASGGAWSVQVSSGTNRSWSDDYVGKLKKRGLAARSVPVMLDGKRWYRIRVGAYPDRETATEARRILEKSFDLKGNVVQGE